MILEHDAQLILSCVEEKWAWEWALRDVCLALVDSRPGDWVRALREPTGYSEDKINRWAEEARLVPPPERALDKSPQTQVRAARRRA